MIVVTGGAGFIGSCVIRALNDRKRKDLVVVDHLDGAKENNLKNKSYIQYFEKEAFLKLILEDRLDLPIDTIIHMGACSSTMVTDAEYLEKNNFEYSRHLAQWSLKHGARFIYASSAATYGDGSLGYSDDDAVTLKLKPLNLYGESKQKFDLWVINNKLVDRVVGLKFFNVYGPNEYHKNEMRSVINKAYDRVKQEGRMTLFKSYLPAFKDGEQKRDFIYVKDAVEIILFFLDRRDVNGIFNIGTNISRTWNDLAHTLFSAVGKTPRIEYIDMPEKIRGKYQYFTQADMSKLKSFGYSKPFFSLEDGIRDYVRYLKDHSYL